MRSSNRTVLLLVVAIASFEQRQHAAAAFVTRKPTPARLYHLASEASSSPGSNDGRQRSMEERLAALGQSQGEAGSMAQQRSSTNKPSFESKTPITVQGGSLKTWSLQSAAIEKVQIVLKTEGRPLDADIDLWHGPDNTPHKMRVYVEDGTMRPFHALLETPRGPNTVAIRNIGQLEFPLVAHVVPNPKSVDRDSASNLASSVAPRVIQGGALRTYPFDAGVESVQVMLKTDGRPLNARIELLQGPNNIKQVIEMYIEDGDLRPFFAIIETPGSGNVVRVVNTATVEFPMSVWVEPYVVGDGDGASSDIVVGGDGSDFGVWDPQWKK